MAEINAKIVGKVMAPVKPVRESFGSDEDFAKAIEVWHADMMEFEAEQAEAAQVRAAAEAGDHGPVEAGPGAGSPDYNDGNIRVLK